MESLGPRPGSSHNGISSARLPDPRSTPNPTKYVTPYTYLHLSHPSCGIHETWPPPFTSSNTTSRVLTHHCSICRIPSFPTIYRYNASAYRSPSAAPITERHTGRNRKRRARGITRSNVHEYRENRFRHLDSRIRCARWRYQCILHFDQPNCTLKFRSCTP
jgi:hypothetical protein